MGRASKPVGHQKTILHEVHQGRGRGELREVFHAKNEAGAAGFGGAAVDVAARLLGTRLGTFDALDHVVLESLRPRFVRHRRNDGSASE